MRFISVPQDIKLDVPPTSFTKVSGDIKLDSSPTNFRKVSNDIKLDAPVAAQPPPRQILSGQLPSREDIIGALTPSEDIPGDPYKSIVQPVQQAVTTAKEYLPTKILESRIGDVPLVEADAPGIGVVDPTGAVKSGADVRAAAATAAKLVADIAEWVLLPSGKLKVAGKVVTKAAEKLGGKAFGKAAATAAMALPGNVVKGAEFGALQPSETPVETLKNAAEMGLFTALIEVGVGGALAVNAVKKLAANAKAAGTKMPEDVKALKTAAQEIKGWMEGRAKEPLADTGVKRIKQPLVEGLGDVPEPVPQVKLEALQEKLGEPKIQKPKEINNAVKEGVQPEIGKPEYQKGNEGGQTAEAGRGDSVIGEAQVMPGEKAININLDKLETTNDVKNLIKETSKAFEEKINVQRRGKITQEQTQELADSLGMTPKRLIKTRQGKAFNAEEAKASRDILVKSAEKSMKLAEKYMKDSSEETLAEFTTALTRHVEIQKAVSGITAEAGRTLSQFRMKAVGLKKAKQLEMMIDQFGGKEKAQFIAEKLSQMSKMPVADRAKFIIDSTKATTMDKVFEAWVNGLLSSPTTHLVNITSNALTFLSKLPERAIGTTLDLLKSKATGTKRQRFYGELPYQVVGGWQGLKEGVRKGLYAFINEVSPEMATKLDVQRYQAISGKKGKIIRIPGRLLIAADEFFKAVNYQSELYGLSYRQAAKEGNRGTTRTKRMVEILSDPTTEMKEKADKEMLYRVFQKELGPFGKGLQQLRGKSSALKLLIPFLRTPINIAKFGLERTILNAPLLMKKALKGDIKGAEVTDEAAKIVMGSMIGAGIYTMVNEGSVTGWGPKKPAERAALYRTGWQPYSLKIGDKYYSYFRLEPLGMIFGLAADFAELKDQMTADEVEDLPALVALAIGRNIINKTFMRGLSDALNAMSDPERHGKRWVRGLGSTIIPRGVASVARAIDPEMRQTDSFEDYLKTQVPEWSKDLFPRRDLWGRPITRGGTTATRLFSPSRVSEIKKDPVDNEMLRLEIYVGKPRNIIKGIKLTATEYDEYQKLAGEKGRLKVEQYMNSPFYKKADDARKAKVIKRKILEARDFARRQIYFKIPVGRK